MKKIIKNINQNNFVWINSLVFGLLIVLFVTMYIVMKSNGYIKNNVFAGDVITQNFTISEVSGSDAIARQIFYSKGCKKGMSNVLRFDISDFVNSGIYDISSISIYYSKNGSIVGANIDYVPAGRPTLERLIFFTPSYDLSNRTLISEISDFVSDPLYDVLDVQYVKDEKGGVMSAAILYKDVS